VNLEAPSASLSDLGEMKKQLVSDFSSQEIPEFDTVHFGDCCITTPFQMLIVV